MRSTGSLGFSLPVSLAAPVEVLPRRSLRVSFSSPTPLLRALGPGEKPDDARWSACLAEWGWAVAPEGCAPGYRWPACGWTGRRGRVVSGVGAGGGSATACRWRAVAGVAQGDRDRPGRVWRTISSLSQDPRRGLALALLRANADVFNFASVAPSWPADVGLVIAERRRLRDERSRRRSGCVWLRPARRCLQHGAHHRRDLRRLPGNPGRPMHRTTNCRWPCTWPSGGRRPTA